MITIILGFATALAYGFADFFGAVASKTLKSIYVTAVASLSGLAMMLIVSTTLGATFSASTMFWGISAGLASAFAMSCLYAALAIGPISIISPLTAVISAIVPSIVGILQGDRFSLWGWLALVLIFAAVILVGFVPGKDVRLPSAAGLIYGTMAGLGIGLVLVFLHQAPSDSGLAPVILLRIVGSVVLGSTSVYLLLRARVAVGAAVKPTFKPSPKVWAAVVAAGLFDSLANLFFLLAARAGSLTVASVLTALYPVGTILLARLVLRERIATSQTLGIGLAIAGCMLLAIA